MRSTACPRASTTRATWATRALRTYVMGQRAFTERRPRTISRRWCISTQGRDRGRRHRLLDHAQRQPHDLRRQAGGEPARDLARVRDARSMAMGAGMVEIAGEPCGADARRRARVLRGPQQARVECGPADHLRPVQPARGARARWRTTFDIIERTAAAGRPHVRPGAQPGAERAAVLRDASCRSTNGTCGSDMRKLPLAEQKQWLLDRRQARAGRDRLAPYEGPPVRGAEARPPEWDWIFALTDMKGPHTMAELARRAQHASGRADDRHGARARHEVLHDPADRQREPGPRRSS